MPRLLVKPLLIPPYKVHELIYGMYQVPIFVNRQAQKIPVNRVGRDFCIEAFRFSDFDENLFSVEDDGHKDMDSNEKQGIQQGSEFVVVEGRPYTRTYKFYCLSEDARQRIDEQHSTAAV